MKVTAARVHSHDQPLVVEEIELAAPGPDEVLVELKFAGVNPIDRYLAGGRVNPDLPCPRIAGSEASGLVKGKPVVVNGAGLGSMRNGVYASAVIAPKQAVLPIPDDIDMAEAACLGVAGVTAWNVVNQTAQANRDDRVVVLGAGGGVGLPIISLLHSLGAEIWGQVRTESKTEAVLKAGANNVVVTDAQRLTEHIKEFEPTLVIDPLGGAFTAAGVLALAPRGRIVLYGTSAGPTAELPLQFLYRNMLSVRGYGGFTLTETERREGVQHAADAVSRGDMTIPVDRVMSLIDINQAFEDQADGKITGKLVLDLS